MPRARKSTGKKVRRSVSKSPRKVRSAPKVRKARVSKKASKRTSRKKVNKWIVFIKEQAKKHGITYGAALSDPKIRALYKKA